MRYFVFIFFALLVFLSSCKKDAEYHNYNVDFYTSLGAVEVQEAVFETIAEQMLLKEAHNANGAVFETVTEQVLLTPAYTIFKISDSQTIHIVQNAETNTIIELDCIHLYNESDFEQTEVPAVYVTRAYQKVIDPGTGPEVDATYETRYYERLESDSELIIMGNTERESQRYIFTIPAEMTISEYLIDQMAQHGIQDCMEGFEYVIEE